MSHLLRATALRLRADATFDNHEVDAELDDQAPAASGDLYVMVTDGGVTENRPNATSGTILDLSYGVDITVALKSPQIPRDRLRQMITEKPITGGAVVAYNFLVYERVIMGLVHMDYTLMASANTLIFGETGSTDEFFVPLRLIGKSPITPAPPTVFAHQEVRRQNTPPAMMRTSRYRGARRIEII